MAQRRVLLGTPAYTWSLDVRYVHSFGMTIKLCMEKGIDFRWVFTPGDALVQSACNDLVMHAREKDFDDLIIIGSDQDWEAEWVVRLLSYPVDVVAGPVRKKTDERELYNVRIPGGPESLRRHPDHDIVTAPDLAIGTGFMRLSRKALDLLWDNSPKYGVVGSDKKAAWIFDVRPVDGKLVGEDIHICHKLRLLGVDIWLDPMMNSGHCGQKRWQGDFANWLARVQ